MQHRQDNLLANRNLLPGMVSGQYAFRIRTLSQVVRYFSLLPCLCILSFSSPAAMLSPGDRSAIQQQQQQLLDENQRQRDALERSAPLTITPSPETSAGTEGPCFTVSRIVVSGATRLTSGCRDGRLYTPGIYHQPGLSDRAGPFRGRTAHNGHGRQAAANPGGRR